MNYAVKKLWISAFYVSLVYSGEEKKFLNNLASQKNYLLLTENIWFSYIGVGLRIPYLENILQEIVDLSITTCIPEKKKQLYHL